MSSRHRQRHSTVRSTPGRPSMAPAATPGPSMSSTAQLPEYRKPSHPLNPTAQLALRDIHNERVANGFEAHVKQAAECITEAAGAINDSAHERGDRVKRRQKKWAKGRNTDEQPDEEDGLRRLQTQVDDLTTKLDKSMRDAIDDEAGLRRIADTMAWLRENAPGRQQQEYLTQMTQRTHSQAQQSQRGRRDEDGDEDMEDDEPPTPGPTPFGQERVALTGLSALFSDRMERKKEEYLSYSHQSRYAKNNSYINFKAVVHDAKHRDDGAPMPHANSWFPELGRPAPGVTATQQGAEDEDDDLIIDKANISTKCPLTLKQFVEPFRSKKCPHTFEKSAILPMIRNSRTDGRAGATKWIQCPVPGCDQTLAATDLHDDALTTRKIKRMQKSQAREAESDSDSDDDVAPPRRPQADSAIISDDEASAPSASRSAPHKQESASPVPRSQVPPQSSVMDLGDPSDGEEDVSRSQVPPQSSVVDLGDPSDEDEDE